MKTDYPPGHPQAIKAGCKCPANDNEHGAGAYIDTQGNTVYWFDFACPLHGEAEQVALETILFKSKKEKTEMPKLEEAKRRHLDHYRRLAKNGLLTSDDRKQYLYAIERRKREKKSKLTVDKQ